MTWSDITVFQWQQLNELFLNAKKDLTYLDISVKATAIITGKTEHQIDSLSMKELNVLLKEIEFINETIVPQTKKYINVNGKRYKCIYDIRQMPAARYIETKHFSTDVNGNLHKIAACMVLPMKKTLFGWRIDKYDASKHEEYANDLLEAKITNVLGSVVFFYHVFRIWIKVSKDYLINQLMEMGMSKSEALETYLDLCKIMDGFINANWWLNMKKSNLLKYLNYL